MRSSEAAGSKQSEMKSRDECVCVCVGFCTGGGFLGGLRGILQILPWARHTCAQTNRHSGTETPYLGKRCTVTEVIWTKTLKRSNGGCVCARACVCCCSCCWFGNDKHFATSSVKFPTFPIMQLYRAPRRTYVFILFIDKLKKDRRKYKQWIQNKFLKCIKSIQKHKIVHFILLQHSWRKAPLWNARDD